MTKLLEKAFSQASRLSEEQQDQLARQVLAEIESERRWDQLFGESQDGLAQLANETLKKHRQGKTTRLDTGQM